MSSDIAASLKAKELGNAAFKAGDFPASVGHYTSAILADPNNPTFYLNRAAAYLRLGKYQDAERDSSSTLAIQKDNVKALFRRSQARLHLENFEASQDDLRRALKLEPDNRSLREELQRVQARVLEHVKLLKSARPTSSLPKPRTRRLPIEVVDTPPTIGAQGDFLVPVSSRPLLDRSLPSTSLIQIPPVSDRENPKSERSGQQSQSTLHGAKQAGDPKYGGGIFRSSGSHTIFKRETSSAPHTKPQKDQCPPQVITLAAFARSWNTLTTDERKWVLLQQVSPASLSRFFGSSLEADVLSSILRVLLTIASSNESDRSLVKGYMVFLPLVSRFSLIYTFLHRDDKNRVKDIWALLDGAGATDEGDREIKKSWGV